MVLFDDGESDGCLIHRCSSAVFHPLMGIGQAVRTAVGGAMTVLYVVVGLVALGLLIYLFAALLKPEVF
jgi:K+-transporting ATPase KdpF subunit